jgi:hypothetical protein
VRFEPGQSRAVTLIALAGTRTVSGFRQAVMGSLDRPPVKLVKAKSVKLKKAAGRPKPARRAHNSTLKR